MAAISSLGPGAKISTRVPSWVPAPFMASLTSMARYSARGCIKARIARSKFPLNSLFRSLIKS